MLLSLLRVGKFSDIIALKIFSILSAAGVETEEWGVDGGPSFLHL